MSRVYGSSLKSKTSYFAFSYYQNRLCDLPNSNPRWFCLTWRKTHLPVAMTPCPPHLLLTALLLSLLIAATANWRRHRCTRSSRFPLASICLVPIRVSGALTPPVSCSRHSASSPSSATSAQGPAASALVISGPFPQGCARRLSFLLPLPHLRRVTSVLTRPSPRSWCSASSLLP